MRNPLIAVIDYDIGNIASMVNALKSIGASVLPVRNREQIKAADALVLPGVGAFRQGMQNLEKYDLPAAIIEHVNQGKPFLGVCLGMQLLFDESDEFGCSPGLGLLSGRVELLKAEEGFKVKLPHIGWNSIFQPAPGCWDNSVFDGLAEGADVYFVHSFAAVPASHEDQLGVTNFGGYRFCSAVQHGNITGCQFHPEKSGPVGLKILGRFVSNIQRGS